jgi:SAM-dependent methyltransferase
MNNRNELGKLYQDKFKTGIGVEVGVEVGNNALEISKYYNGKIICVDKWDNEESFIEAKRKLHGENFIIKKMLSIDAAKEFEDGSFDWIYIDGNHEYLSVKEDINVWYPKLRNGGIFSGHDYCNVVNFGVIKAVDEFAKLNNYEIELTTDDWWENTNYQSWFFIKR